MSGIVTVVSGGRAGGSGGGSAQAHAVYDAGPGRPLSGCGDGAVAMTAMGHYLAAERALARKRVNQDSPGALAALDGEAMLHYVAAIAASLLPGESAR
jgi:hypothetical protein